ncbi:CPBP family intramembrane glutamic endopeptidase [Kosakonia radicincitans]|uniref:CPBP family intramembrane glutamic endopeptidase n=1 Tax=Kosakonia radicincitans TaxID=283686 RepID=UPI0005C32823|nr:CPBP family intramembrane glutamic endopeptidase [Kosakonia radicincitans]KIS44355.1 CAAX protease self-immunity family protein [Kosakonia radicincitans YD4]
MPVQSDRTSHTAVCIAAFVIYYSLFYFAIYIPGFMRLYQNGLDGPFLHGALLLPCSLLLWRYYGRHYDGLLPFGTLAWRNLAAPLLALVAMLVMEKLFQQPEPWLDSLEGYTGLTRWAWIFTACLIAPVSEEIIFRGFLLNASLGWGKVPQQVGIVLTSLLFAAIHMQYQAPLTFIQLFIFSALLCVVRLGTGGLLIPIVLHALSNLFAVGDIFLQ